MAATSIEWTQLTWNPVTGCDRVSPGCDHCYALSLAGRLKAMGQARYSSDGNSQTSGPGFAVTVHPDALGLPMRRRVPARIFVNSMSDLFHHQVPAPYIAQAFAVMAHARQHTFQVLTKRHGRMRSLLAGPAWQARVAAEIARLAPAHPGQPDRGGLPWPLPNVWLGVSAEDQEHATLRLPALAATPAAARFISAEPLLGPIPALRLEGISWLIIGGESGPGARPMDPGWARELIAACRDAGTAVFVKQLGACWARAHGARGKGADPDSWPPDLRVREYPAAASVPAVPGRGR